MKDLLALDGEKFSKEMDNYNEIILSTQKYLLEKEKLNVKVACLLEEKYDGSQCKECTNFEKYCKSTGMPNLYQKYGIMEKLKNKI